MLLYEYGYSTTEIADQLVSGKTWYAKKRVSVYDSYGVPNLRRSRKLMLVGDIWAAMQQVFAAQIFLIVSKRCRC